MMMLICQKTFCNADVSILICLYIPSDDFNRLPLRDALEGIKKVACDGAMVAYPLSDSILGGIIFMGGIIFLLVKTRRDKFRPPF